MDPSAAPERATLLVMGMAGAGKTTVARHLAHSLAFAFLEGDAYHPPVNIAKMRRGEPLDDADRAPWLAALRRAIENAARDGRSVVVAASALRRVYRAALLDGLPRVAIVFLRAAPDLLHGRIAQRAGHFMPAELIDSQVATLEPPTPLESDELLAFAPWRDRALFVDAATPVEEIVSGVIERLAPSPRRS